MTTVINTPGNGASHEDSGAGWAVAVVILIMVIAVGVYLWIRYNPATAQPSGATNINVTIPASPIIPTPVNK